MSHRTPGPWNARKTGMGGHHIWAGKNIVALVYSTPKASESEENARYISNAPEMLEVIGGCAAAFGEIMKKLDTDDAPKPPEYWMAKENREFCEEMIDRVLGDEK